MVSNFDKVKFIYKLNYGKSLVFLMPVLYRHEALLAHERNTFKRSWCFLRNMIHL